MKDRLINAMKHCITKEKSRQLLKEYLNNKYPLEDIISLSLFSHIIDDDIIKKLDKYDINELKIISRRDLLYILDYYASLCIENNRLRAVLLILHYRLYNIIKPSLDDVYELYKEYEDEYPEIKDYIINASVGELCDLYSSDDNNLSDTCELKKEVLDILAEKKSPEELYKIFIKKDYDWYINYLVNNNDLEKLYELYKAFDEEKPLIFNLIILIDNGKYTYKMLTECNLSDSQRLLLENKLYTAPDREYRYYYMFYKNKNYILDSFISWSAFLLFVSSFSDKKEIEKIKLKLDSELKSEFSFYESEFEHNRVKIVS